MSDEVDWEHWRDTFESGITAGHTSSQGRRAMIDEGRSVVARWHEAGLFGPTSSVLDIGCGNGRVAVGFLPHAVVEYHGVDIVKGSIDFCRAAFAEHQQYRFTHLDVHNGCYNPRGLVAALDAVFPVPTGAIDFLILSSVLTHVSSWAVVERYLAEAHRCLRSGGMLFVTFFRSPPNAPSVDEVRASYPESAIRAELARGGWVVRSERDGMTCGWHDQWQLVLERRSP